MRLALRASLHTLLPLCLLAPLATCARGVPVHPAAAAPPAVQAIAELALLPRRETVHAGELGGQRLVLAWTEASWDHEHVFGELLALASLQPAAPVVLLAPTEDPDELRELVERLGGRGENLDLVPTDLDTFWIRDYGPQAVRWRGQWRLVDFPYDYERPSDDDVPAVLAERFGLALEHTALDIEGGHLLVEAGVCMVSEDVFERNDLQGWTRDEVVLELESLFGCDEVVFLTPLLGEATGHIDIFATVVAPGRVLVGRYEREEDEENAFLLDEAAKLLTEAGLDVHRMPMPSHSGRSLFRTYTNLVVLPTLVLVPTYLQDQRHEDEALALLDEAFPGKTVLPLHADELIELEGALHCVALTLPF